MKRKIEEMLYYKFMISLPDPQDVRRWGVVIRPPTLAAAKFSPLLFRRQYRHLQEDGGKTPNHVNLTMPFFLLVEDFQVRQEESGYNGILLVARPSQGEPPPTPTPARGVSEVTYGLAVLQSD